MSGPRGSGPCSSYWGRHRGRKSTVPRPSPTPLCRDESHCWMRLQPPFSKPEPVPSERMQRCQVVDFRETNTNKYISGLHLQLGRIKSRYESSAFTRHLGQSTVQAETSLQTDLRRTWGVRPPSSSTGSDGRDTRGLCSEASVRRAAWERQSHLEKKLARVILCESYHSINTEENPEAWKQEVNKPSSSPADICCRSIQLNAASSCLIMRYRMIQGKTEKK